jgi:threonine/homoserine/homoserine lactone efflux protein
MPAFVPQLSVILAFAVASVVLAITPGPDMALFISRTINHGRRHGFAAILGAVTGIVVHAGFAAFGLSLLLAASPPAFFALKIAGALYLLFLAIQAIRQTGGLTLGKKPTASRARYSRSFMSGLLSNITNPKVILFFVTFLPQFVSRADPAAGEQMAFLGVEFIVVAMPINLACILGAHWIADTLARSQWVRRALNWSFAAVFAGFAAAILTLEGRR